MSGLGSEKFNTELARRLYSELLPGFYRNRDEPAPGSTQGDLAKFLDACGYMLSLLDRTIDQRLADCFPDPPDSGDSQGLECQDWILPYFASLLSVRLMAPTAEGRREEVAKEVSWRQKKGTLTCVHDVAQSIADTGVEVQEGFKRVATTPRAGFPLLPAEFYGVKDGRSVERHPGIPAATVDLRQPSRAILDPVHANPSGHPRRVGDPKEFWYQANPHGVPCFPGSYEDASARTPDVRTPARGEGLFHPRRLLVYLPAPDGLFASDQVYGTTADLSKDARIQNGGRDPINGTDVWFKPAQNGKPIVIQVSPVFDANKTLLLSGLCVDAPVTYDGVKIVLDRCAIKTLDGNYAGVAGMSAELRATNCVFGDINFNGLVRLESCTVMGDITCSTLQASDTVFNGKITFNPQLPKGKRYPGCVRFSRLQPILDPDEADQFPKTYHVTYDRPVFVDVPVCGIPKASRSSQFEAPGFGVLDVSAPESIRFGAEDGGEMGAFHDQGYCARQKAVADKLKDYLPVGIEPVIVLDYRLNIKPPTNSTGN